MDYARFREFLLKEYIEKNKRWSTKSKFLRDTAPQALAEIGVNTEGVELHEQLYAIVNGLKEWPTCACGKKINFNGLNQYGKTCSPKCHANSLETQNKRKETVRGRYGVDNVSLVDAVVDKIKATTREKYGVDNYMQLQSVSAKLKREQLNRSFEALTEKFPDIEPLFTKEEYEGVYDGTQYKEYEWRCKKCSTTFKKNINNPEWTTCPVCVPRALFSNLELLIKEFLDAHQIRYEAHNRSIISPKELDFYLPDNNVGIEVHGLYWHSDSPREGLPGNIDTMHLEKLDLCISKNIRLVQIFEDELTMHPEIVFARLRNILKIKQPVVMARKCTVGEIKTKEKEQFLKRFHMQGGDKSTFNLGLFDYTGLVAVMTFCPLRAALGRDKSEGAWELSRFATKSDAYIVGAAGKLLAHFKRIKNPKKIISYADRRWSVGDLYLKLGFKHVRNSKPNYWYTNDFKTRKHRYGFSKSLLRKRFGDAFDPQKTERQNMTQNGYHRIYDCGNMVFEA